MVFAVLTDFQENSASLQHVIFRMVPAAVAIHSQGRDFLQIRRAERIRAVHGHRDRLVQPCAPALCCMGYMRDGHESPPGRG